MVPTIALTETVSQILTGVIAGPKPLLTLLGTLNAPLCYGLGIALIRRYANARRSGLSTPPMPMGLAMILCPIVAVAGSLPWALYSEPHGPLLLDLRQVLGEAGIYWIGDLLGIWMVAPPLLWLSSLAGRRPALTLPPRLWEGLAVFAGGSALSGLLCYITREVHVEPMLICSVWLALRLGRMAAWIAGAVTTLVILVVTGPTTPLGQRANLHLFAATFSITAYLVGSYAEAERARQRDLHRAERLLLHADRLKTLRAMSLAAIHDISQPLSTLRLEARHVRELAAQPEFDRQEMIETSALIERKTNHLTELVRRMRAFGSDDGGNCPTGLHVNTLLADVVALTNGEAEAAGAELRAIFDDGLEIVGREIELQQALVNLVRNGIAAARRGQIVLRARAMEGWVRLEVVDDGQGGDMRLDSEGGMGLGLIIARTIAEAHGGFLAVERLDPAGSCYALCIPQPSEP